MPDPYSQITTVEPAVVNVLIDAMELRAADPQQRVMRAVPVGGRLPEGARVLEAGCGSGRDLPGARDVAAVGQVVGLDPSPALLAKARET
jgi:ubiquinone/menaquinone biosynthesis C-methylase UbiE